MSKSDRKEDVEASYSASSLPQVYCVNMEMYTYLYVYWNLYVLFNVGSWKF